MTEEALIRKKYFILERKKTPETSARRTKYNGLAADKPGQALVAQCIKLIRTSVQTLLSFPSSSLHQRQPSAVVLFPPTPTKATSNSSPCGMFAFQAEKNPSTNSSTAKRRLSVCCCKLLSSPNQHDQSAPTCQRAVHISCLLLFAMKVHT